MIRAMMTWALVATAPLQAATVADAVDPALVAETRMLLDDWARGDATAALRRIDPDMIVMYGSDAAEVMRGGGEAAGLLAADARLWGGAARFGVPRNVSMRRAGRLATLFFDVPFRVGERPELTVRFATVWRRHGGRWLLIQSANVVPTTGQSAAELTRGR